MKPLAGGGRLLVREDIVTGTLGNAALDDEAVARPAPD